MHAHTHTHRALHVCKTLVMDLHAELAVRRFSAYVGAGFPETNSAGARGPHIASERNKRSLDEDQKQSTVCSALPLSMVGNPFAPFTVSYRFQLQSLVLLWTNPHPPFKFCPPPQATPIYLRPLLALSQPLSLPLLILPRLCHLISMTACGKPLTSATSAAERSSWLTQQALNY